MAVASAAGLVAVLAGPIARAQAFTVLTEGKSAAFTRDAAAGTGSARIRVAADPGLVQLLDPTVCPASAHVRIASYPTATNLVTGGPEVALPCERWHRVPGGWQYDDRAGDAGGVTRLRYTTTALALDASGPAFPAVVGPVGFVQLSLRVGEKRLLVRFHGFTRNDERRVESRPASREAAAGERAFWATLGGAADQSDRAIALLRRAVERDRNDGRAWFLLGMMGLWRYELEVPDPRRADAPGTREIVAADRALDRAARLLWSGDRGDSRVPGFAAAARYKAAVALGDEPAVEAAIADMRRLADVNPLFNTFIPFGLGPVEPPRSARYAYVLHLLDVAFPAIAGVCADQGEICFNDGFAPHNLEGTLVLFGDLFAKGGRVEDARRSYLTAAAVGEKGGWNGAFVDRARALADTVDERAALYADGDPWNDPPFTDLGGEGNCAYCHNR
ncbi:MAG TPA: hypothetical protein VFD92_21715 [Candidatus Binatia bacterium]|nr:hypothetical protein [Candidatus Binatia bacterium]